MGILDQFLKNSIQPVLRPLGFRRKGYVFNRQREECVQVIDFQVNRRSSTRIENVTINIGLFIPEVWRLCWGKPLPAFIKEHECFPRFRIGFLLSGFDKRCLDKWWTLTGISTDKAILEIPAVIEDACMPFLDSTGKRSAILEFVKAKARLLMPIDEIQLAILNWLHHDTAAALSVLEKYASDRHWGMKVSEIRQRLMKLAAKGAALESGPE